MDGEAMLGGQENVTRIGKYLNEGTRRLVPFGKDDGAICVYPDSAWAGCLRTRQSTSGEIL